MTSLTQKFNLCWLSSYQMLWLFHFKSSCSCQSIIQTHKRLSCWLINGDLSFVKKVWAFILPRIKFHDCSHNVNLRSKPDLLKPFVKSVLKGKNPLRYFGSLMWNSLPINIRNSESLPVAKIKVWKPDNCTCRLQKEYLNGVGFI